MPRIRVAGAGSMGLVTGPYEQDIPPTAWSRVRNARFGDKGAQSFLGHTQVLIEDGVPTPITPTWVKFYPDLTDPRWVFADNNEVWVYEDFTYTDISRIDDPYNAIDRWQGTLFNGIGIMNNGFDPPQQWSPARSTQRLVNLSNWPGGYRCRFIKPFKNFLIAGHLYDGANSHPLRVMWSHPATVGSVPPNWTFNDPASDAGTFELAITSDALIDGLAMGEIFIVYREGSTWGMQLTGDNQIFRNWRISGSAGAIWKDCVMETPKGHVVAGWEDIVVHMGTAGSFQSILEKRFRKQLVARRSQAYFHNSFMTQSEPEKEVWFCFPEEGHVYPNLAVVWNWVDGQVGLRDLPEVPFADAGPVLVEA